MNDYREAVITVQEHDKRTAAMCDYYEDEISVCKLLFGIGGLVLGFVFGFVIAIGTYCATYSG